MDYRTHSQLSTFYSDIIIFGQMNVNGISTKDFKM